VNVPHSSLQLHPDPGTEIILLRYKMSKEKLKKAQSLIHKVKHGALEKMVKI